MRTTTTWTGTLTATSSIAHGGERRGTISLLRREMLHLPDGERVFVPVISGNALRGTLRRIAEELFTQALDLEGAYPLPAAQILRGGGGALTRSRRAPLTGARLRHVRDLLPPLALFGGTSTRTIGGSLLVGKVWPHMAETAHLTGDTTAPPMFEATQLETFSRLDETDELPRLTHVPLTPDGSIDDDALTSDGPMLFRHETYPAGTRFSTWLRLEHATPLTTAFATDLVAEFTARGRLGGRRNTGHGTLTAAWQTQTRPDPAEDIDWRTHLLSRRDDVLTALGELA